MKPVLWYSLFYFYHFGGYFERIWGTVAKIWAKMFIRRLWNRRSVIRCSIFRTFEVIFWTFEVIFSQLKVGFQKHKRKRSFSRFENCFTVFAVLFLALWSLFLLDYRYCCQDMGKTFIRQLWNRFCGISCSIFSTLEIILSWSEVLLPRYERKCSFSEFENGLMAFAVQFLASWRLFFGNGRYNC